MYKTLDDITQRLLVKIRKGNGDQEDRFLITRLEVSYHMAPGIYCVLAILKNKFVYLNTSEKSLQNSSASIPDS